MTATATVRKGGPATSATLRVDGETVATRVLPDGARTVEVVVDGLSPGKHTFEMTVGNARGGATSKEVTVKVK